MDKKVQCYSCLATFEETDNEIVKMGKNYGCRNCLSFGNDEWEKLELDYQPGQLEELSKLANEENVTINMLICRALQNMVKDFKGLSEEEIKAKIEANGN